MARQLRLDICHYEIVRAIVEHGSMASAAESLSMRQSTLNYRLAEAEQLLGAALVERDADRSLGPTQEGKSVHRAAVKVLAVLRRLESQFGCQAAIDREVIRLGVAGYETYEWFPCVAETMHREHPHLGLELAVVGDDPAEALHGNTADIVLMLGDPRGDVAVHDLFVDELVLVCSPEHSLACRPFVTCKDLEDQTVFSYNSCPRLHYEDDRFMQDRVMPGGVQVMSQTASIIELVAAGAGVSILSRWATIPSIQLGRLVQIQCGTDGITVPWRAATRRDDASATVVAEHLVGRL